jgi:hypothetical protein
MITEQLHERYGFVCFSMRAAFDIARKLLVSDVLSKTEKNIETWGKIWIILQQLFSKLQRGSEEVTNVTIWRLTVESVHEAREEGGGGRRAGGGGGEDGVALPEKISKRVNLADS